MEGKKQLIKTAVFTDQLHVHIRVVRSSSAGISGINPLDVITIQEIVLVDNVMMMVITRL